ncbi:MAG: metalloregulator ArsR/SmtB family transcription factor [Bacteroidia bacterium]|nr:metalloregulator ArsR/SmtB family transcription factor [Bacteroidia bacterium]
MNAKTKAPYLEKEWIETSEKIKALAHPIRLYIIALLKNEKEMNVSELQEALDLEQAVVSHHLNILKGRGVLNCRRDGKNMFYSLKNRKFLNVLSCIETSFE